MDEDLIAEEIRLPATEDEIRQALVILLSRMRPDWGSDKAIAGRVRFAEERLRLSLPRVCVDAVRGAAIPGSPPDVFIATKVRRPTEGRAADPDQTAELIRRTRIDLIGRKPISRR
ncbi:hypothetical protein AB0J63_46070 [Streptosporangium canum]|uniref:hypothetical protein n=1 Tax=Streptosporangium canum TaxID=324952 RepID=UPI003437B5AB